jgi:DUF1009 family protein
LRKLGILAGSGPLPGRVAAAARAAGRDVFIVGLDGVAEAHVIAPFDHQMIRLGAAGRIVAELKARACQDLVMIGPIRRPSLLNMRPDAEGARLLARIGRAAFAGDDGLLKAVIRILGEEGFSVIGAHDILGEALGPTGLLTEISPDAQAMADIARGVAVAKLLGGADAGQGCVVQQGLVIALEAIEGTDAMLQRAAQLRRPGPGGVLVKLLKPGQDRRADLPTIGPVTIAHAIAAGLRGVAFEAEATILISRAVSVAAANQGGIFLLGIDPTQFGATP